MVTWNKESLERLISALLAAHPTLTLDYRLMAVFFGQGATYDSLQTRFREYRQAAQVMRAGASGSPDLISNARRPTPRTPKTPRTTNTTPRTNSRGGVSKLGFSDKAMTTPSRIPETPTKATPGSSAHDCILLDDSDSEYPFIKKDQSPSAEGMPKIEHLGAKNGFEIFGVREEVAVPELQNTGRGLQSRAESLKDKELPPAQLEEASSNYHSIYGNLDELDETV